MPKKISAFTAADPIVGADYFPFVQVSSGETKRVTLENLEDALDHTAILNIGSNTHAQIDTHIADTTKHFLMLDEDDMATDSATKASTQQAIKKYVDDQVATANELTELTDVTITSVADNEVLAYNNATTKWINQTAAEAGLQTTLTFGIANTNALQIDHATAADNDYAKLTASGIEGRAYSEVMGDLSGQAGATFSFNSQDITAIGTMGLTAARITKGWFTDITCTNSIAGDITGNAATATALETARTIGGVSFDGTANISVLTATGGFTVSGGALATGANDITLTGAIGRDTDNEIGWGTDDSLAIVIGGVTHNIVSISTGTGDNDKLATQGYVDDEVSGANKALSNLTGVAINTTLVSDTDNTDALGTAAIGWSDIFLGNTSVITWSTAPSTSDLTLTHSANTLTFAGGTIALGTATATGGLTGDVTGNCSGSSGSCTGEAATVATIAGLAPDTATTQATQANITTCANLVTVGALNSGSITSGFGAIDNGTSNITTGGIIKIDIDGTAENAAGSLTMGAGNDAGIFFNGTDLVIITNGAGASGIILDSEDDTVEIKGSGVLQATFDTGGLNLVSGDAYEINGVSVLNATTLGGAVVNSSLTSVGTIATGVWEGTDIGVAHGGTGVSTLTDHGVLVGSGAAAITALAVGTNGQVLVGSTGADPVFATITDGEGITTTLGAGTLQIDCEDASTTNKGVVELATTAETTTGTDTGRAVTPDGLHDMTSLSGAAWMLDEDNMASNSATKVASQQSIKAYVDSVAAQLTQEEVEDYAGEMVANATGTHTGITITYQDATGDMDFVVDHDAASNFVANEHIDHTGVTLTAGTGLTGGGDISSNRTFNVDVGIADDKIMQVDDADAADNDYAKFTLNGLEGRSYAEVRTDLGLVIGTDVLAEQTIGIADNNLLEVDGSPNDDEYARFTANGLEGRTEAEFKEDFNLEIGTDVQAQDTELDAIASTTSAANKLPYYTGSGTATTTDIIYGGTSYNATLTNITEGNGTKVSYYMRVANRVTVFFSFIFGSTSSMDGNPSISLPFNAHASYTTQIPLGVSHYLDAGVVVYGGSICYGSATTATFRCLDVSGTYGAFKSNVSSSVPMTWATNDEITCSFTYIAA